jgi:hypothetical protein
MIKIDQLVDKRKPEHVVSLRCPVCHHNGIFEALHADDQETLTHNQGNPIHYISGQRRCPNPNCHYLLLFVYNHSLGVIETTYPPERIDFDATNLPLLILNALEEAITCHANQCFIASAIMIRKTLELLCKDRGATGSNLKQRVQQLGTKVILPNELLEGLDDLRLLGNDAAHIESEHYDKVSNEEVELAIDITKEVLKAVYQYTALLSRLKALRKP